MKKFILLYIAMTYAVCVVAQKADSSRVFHHEIGLQANQLFRQLINLNTGSSAISNPYDLTYSLFSGKCYWGIETGVGYSYQRSKDNLASANQESKINDIFYRGGIVKIFYPGRHWEITTGLDYEGSYQLDKTFSFTVTDFGQVKDSTSSVSASLSKSSGAGAQLGLGYTLGKYVMLRTEVTLYYSNTRKKNNVLVSDTSINSVSPDQNSYALSASNTDVEGSDFTITLPVALFLTIKF